MRHLPALLAITALLATVGCSEVSSEKVKTNDLDVTIVVTGDEDGIDVTASLFQNFHTTVDLVDGDVLVAGTEAEDTTLSGSGHYSGRLDVAPEPGTVVTVALDRGTEDDAPDSTATLPDPVAVLKPQNGRVFDPAKELTITVDDAPGDLYVAWTGPCVLAGDTFTTPGAVTGREIVVPADAVKRATGRETESCTVELEVIRQQEGELDPAYDKGSIVGRQHATIPLRIKPGQAPSPSASTSSSTS